MDTIEASSVDAQELDQLDVLASEFPNESVLRSAVEAVSNSVRAGHDVIVAEESELVSPATAAKLIGVSRTHLYKSLDCGELPFTNVGRDRRISLTDVRQFILDQDDERKRTAERLAHTSEVRSAALEKYKQKNR